MSRPQQKKAKLTEVQKKHHLGVLIIGVTACLPTNVDLGFGCEVLVTVGAGVQARFGVVGKKIANKKVTVGL